MTKARLMFFMLLSITLFSTGRLYAELDVKSLIDSARISLDKSAAKGFEWTTTRGLISAAEAALAKGDKAQSLALAKAALNEAEKSLTQANYADAHWLEGIPR